MAPAYRWKKVTREKAAIDRGKGRNGERRGERKTSSAHSPALYLFALFLKGGGFAAQEREGRGERGEGKNNPFRPPLFCGGRSDPRPRLKERVKGGKCGGELGWMTGDLKVTLFPGFCREAAEAQSGRRKRELFIRTHSALDPRLPKGFSPPLPPSPCC